MVSEKRATSRESGFTVGNSILYIINITPVSSHFNYDKHDFTSHLTGAAIEGGFRGKLERKDMGVLLCI